MWRDIGYRQRGMGLLALIFWALVSVFVFMVALKILPVYKENMAIKKTLSAMASDSILQNGEKWEIRKSFNERADIDDISSVNGGDLEIDKEDGRIVLGIAYSVKTPLFANISLYIDFNESSGK
ncbi:MAG: DUF4845 domain-containing protein [Nitrosomonadaceae bacterium]|nr:DUF4845 domain-containing protein [Nitrosomonadaceae bacterium]